MRNHPHKRRKPCVLHQKKKVSSPRFGWISSNWSGYARKGTVHQYRRISAEWTVPYLLPSSRNAYSSAWIGIDGFENSSLIQTGTGHDWIQGKPSYYAWWEILPAAETIIPHPVSPGHRIRAVITRLTRKTWCITLSNLTLGWTFRTIQCYSGPQSSAEWIVEAPTVGSSIASMARLTPVTFSMCRLNGCAPTFRTSQKGIMIQGRSIVSIPGNPNRCKDGFTVRRYKVRRNT
ncbi:G1 family endopeptidase [Paenibacillus amylolyticus]|nr:G1 family glutamic endopeptidase [Paenibacillus amylolyticus]WFR62027.1 G1 family endopeptidase [Paenibacillus amylolyticus]